MLKFPFFEIVVIIKRKRWGINEKRNMAAVAFCVDRGSYHRFWRLLASRRWRRAGSVYSCQLEQVNG